MPMAWGVAKSGAAGLNKPHLRSNLSSVKRVVNLSSNGSMAAIKAAPREQRNDARIAEVEEMRTISTANGAQEGATKGSPYDA